MEITQDFSHMTNEELLDEYMHNRSREIKEELILRYIQISLRLMISLMRGFLLS